jgi:hypothetical protein
MGVTRPINYPTTLVQWLDADKPIGSSGPGDTALATIFLGTEGDASGDIVIEIRDDSSALAEVTILSGTSSILEELTSPVALTADTLLYSRITTVPVTEYALSGYIILQAGDWTADIDDEPITLAETKLYLRVDHSVDDNLISALIVAARQAAESETRRAIVGRTETYYLDAWPGKQPEWFDGYREGPVTEGLSKRIDLPYGPLRSVTSVKTYDDADAATVFASSNYFVNTERAQIVLRNGKIWPAATRTAQAIEVVYVTGYAAPANVPREIKLGLKNHIGVMYEKRDTEAPMPDSSRQLYGKYYIVRDMI